MDNGICILSSGPAKPCECRKPDSTSTKHYHRVSVIRNHEEKKGAEQNRGQYAFTTTLPPFILKPGEVFSVWEESSCLSGNWIVTAAEDYSENNSSIGNKHVIHPP
jgi:hypothetical protein